MSEELDHFLARWQQEIQIRVSSVARPDVMLLPAAVRDKPHLEPGSILVAWAYDSTALDPARQLIERGAPVGTALDGTLDDLDQGEGSEDVLEVVPAIGTLRYEGRDLVPIAMIPPAPGAIGATVLTWTGQELDPDRFEVTSWVAASGQPLAFLVVCNPPEPNAEEARLLANLPETVAQLGVQPMTTPITAIAATETAAAGAVTRFVATYVAGKAVDKGIDAARDYTRNINRRQAAEEARAQKQFVVRAQAQRAAYRNMSLLPVDSAPAADNSKTTGATIDELLARRYEALEAIDEPGEE